MSILSANHLKSPQGAKSENDLLPGEIPQRQLHRCFEERTRETGFHPGIPGDYPGKIEAQVYEEYEADDPYFIMSEQEYMDFRSKYLDIAIGHTGNEEKETPGATPAESEPERIDDVDFCLELLHSDVINVAYILELIADLNPDSEDYQQKRQQSSIR